MKRNLLLLTAVALLFFVVYFWWPCIMCWFYYPYKTKKGDKCQRYKELRVQTLNPNTLDSMTKHFKSHLSDSIESTKTPDIIPPDDSVTVQIPYVCNELILAPSLAHPHEKEMRKYLKCQGFKLERTCACSDSLELWSYQGKGEANLIEVVKDPKKDASGQNIGGLSLNYEVNIDDNLRVAHIDTLKLDIKKQSENGINITIGISDSGVDLDSSSPFIANNYLWQDMLSHTPPCITPGHFGLSKLTNYLEPIDQIGHGTFINGILMGAAKCVNNTQKPINVNLRLLNIKNSDSTKLSVFDAICGLYFGVEQGVKLFNISWGFLEEKSTAAPEIFKMFLRTTPPDVMLIAGMGNQGNGNSPYGLCLDYNARFWPACLAETENRVISVGASNQTDTYVANFSNYSLNHNRMTMLAPGENIISLVPKSLQLPFSQAPTGYTVGSGTSYSTPFVTRKVAMMRTNITDPVALKTQVKLTGSTLMGFPIEGM